VGSTAGGAGGGLAVRPGRIIKRSDSSNSIHSLRKGLARRRTVSTSLVPTLATSAKSEKEDEAEETLPPFFVSRPAKEEVNPCFHVDRSNFLVPSLTGDDANSADSQFPDDDSIDSWSGLRESRIRVKVFARRRSKDREREREKELARRSEKGKAREDTQENEEDDEAAGWKILTEWDVDLSSLVSLGRNVSSFLLFAFEKPRSTQSRLSS